MTVRDRTEAEEPGGGRERDLTAEVRFPIGYRMTIGPARDGGRRDVRVHDGTGRASGHTAVDSVAELKALAARVRGHTPVVRPRSDDGEMSSR